eukprot:CAMPEP_0118828598 /NCGR_PEP_ID=MMETSP1162-20130426/19000_1 /TAXON_ID=33656 /ORGANISM="Phaeocystis Sp, Strain CCMP2710" /LENGTH=230 /DNA_ID=CAMNT_0006759627 /DNA_START=57 /DNA_END=749 /DNA_ORIENTATION=+
MTTSTSSPNASSTSSTTAGLGAAGLRPVGIVKIKSSREKIASEDRTDNSFCKLLKAVGHVRTKDQPRTIKLQVELLVDYLGKLSLEDFPSMLVSHLITVLEWLNTINSQTNVNRRDYPLEFKVSLKALCSDEGISSVHDAAVAAGLFTKPAAKPVYKSLREAVEEIERLKSIIKAKDAEIEALKNPPYVNLANTNLDTQHDGDLDEAGGSFTTEDTGALSFAEMQALMNV